MKPPRTYVAPEPFKQALEQRLKSSSKSGADFARRRQLLVFDRFLARVVAIVGEAATLKGGLVLELRLGRARTTKDVDLRMVGAPDELLARNQIAHQHTVQSTERHANRRDDQRVADRRDAFGEDHVIVLEGQRVIGAEGHHQRGEQQHQIPWLARRSITSAMS